VSRRRIDPELYLVPLLREGICRSPGAGICDQNNGAKPEIDPHDQCAAGQEPIHVFLVSRLDSDKKARVPWSHPVPGAATKDQTERIGTSVLASRNGQSSQNQNRER